MKWWKRQVISITTYSIPYFNYPFCTDSGHEENKGKSRSNSSRLNVAMVGVMINCACAIVTTTWCKNYASTGAKARRRAKKIVQNLTIAKETAESLLDDDDDDGILWCT